VGIATTAPDGPLTVQLAASSNTSWSMAAEGLNTAQLSHIITDTTSVRRKLSAIEGFVGSSASANFQGGLIFKTTPAAGSPTERMRIVAGGNVGIGTSSPISKLHVDQGTASITAASNNTALRVAYNVAQQAGDSYFMGVTDNGGSSNTGKLQFLNAGSTPLVTMQFNGHVGIGTSSPSEKLSVTGNVTISGSLSKGSGSFKIDHPIKPETHHLVHSFIEGPQADNIYRGKATLVGGTATVNLDEAGRMTEGTFVALNGNVQCFTNNEDGWTAVRGKVDGNILTIEAQDATCTDTVSWLVIGERHDQHMIDANWTDEQGRIITEPEKETAA
jgi:hypothetical protein